MVNVRHRIDFGRSNFLPLIISIIILGFNCEIWAVTKRALLIGIDDYSIAGLQSLQGPVNDLRLIKKVLVDKFHFREGNIITLLNKNATHTSLEKAFSMLAQKTEKGDFIYIHYCGHGSQIPDKEGDEYPGLFDQTWVPYGSRSTMFDGKDRYDIIDDEFHQWLSPVFDKTSHVVLVSDSCYSGSITRGDILTARSVSPDERSYPSLSKVCIKEDFDSGILIGAAQDDELAYEGSFNGKVHGLFSWYWVNALRQARPGDTWSDLFQRTRILVSNYFDQQHPQFQGDTDMPVFGIDINRSRPRVPINRIWNNGQEVRIEAGSLSGVYVGSMYRFYNPGEKNSSRLPLLEITKVTPFYSEARVKGTFQFEAGDLVIEESNAPPFEIMSVFWAVETPFSGISEEMRLLMKNFEKIICLKRFKNQDSFRALDVNLSITLWLPAAKPGQENEVCLELPGNKGWFRKYGVFSPLEMEKRQAFPPGSLLTFKIKNISRADCYVYILDIMENGVTEAVFPSPGDRWQKALLPADSELDLKNIVLLLLNKPGKEVIKLIAAEAPVNVALLEQKISMLTGRGPGKHWGTIQFSITIGKEL
jgi:hypothetical protein